MAARAFVVWVRISTARVHIIEVLDQLTEHRATSLKVSAEGMGGIRGGSVVMVVVDVLALSNVRPHV